MMLKLDENLSRHLKPVLPVLGHDALRQRAKDFFPGLIQKLPRLPEMKIETC